MKCLFTDILSAAPPGNNPPYSGFQFIPGTEQLILELEQGSVLLQQWEVARYELTYIQSSLRNTIVFEIRHPFVSNTFLYALTGKMEVNTFHNESLYLREGHGHFFINAPVQGFCTFKINRVNPSILIVCVTSDKNNPGQSFTMTPAVQEIIERILFTSYAESKYFQEKQIDELLTNTILSATLTRPPVHFGTTDLEGIHLVKQMIDQAPEKDYTLMVLGQKAGMNMRKLNIGFKNLYQQTIFEYLHDKRMTAAHEKIDTTTTSLKIIARAAGYRSYANFSFAFKKHFGINPSDLRKSYKVRHS